MTSLSPEAARLFTEIVADIPNWSGVTPAFNHIIGNARKGYLTDLKKRGLVSTFEYDGASWIELTLQGIRLAAEVEKTSL